MDKKDMLTQIVIDVQKDRRQFELLYSHIVNKIYFWCFMIIGNETDAKDATQEVMLRIYNNLDAVDQPEYFRSWMYRISRNYCVNYLRTYKKNETEYYHNENYSESSEIMVREKRTENIPHEAFDLKETKLLLRSFIDKLPRKQKEVIILFYLEEMKISEIAKALDYNEGSVKSRLHSGRKNLESQISDYQKENNVKLYSLALLPLLLLLLKDYQDEVCAKQDLSYDKNKFKDSKARGIPKKITIISAIAIGTIAIVLLLFNSSSKEDTGRNSGSVDYHKNNLSLLSEKKGWVTATGGEVTERGGTTSITYTFEVADGPLTALHGHLYWDPELMEYDSVTKDNVEAWGNPKEGHLEFINVDGTRNERCSITIYYKNVLPKEIHESEIPIHFEFESSTSSMESERKLITFAGKDLLAMEPDEVIIPVNIKVKYVPNQKNIENEKGN